MGREKSIVLVWLCKTPRGWLRLPVLIEKEHGRDVAKVGYVMDRGREMHYPEGRFQLRQWRDGKYVFINAPEHIQHGRDAVLWHERVIRESKRAPGTVRRAHTIKTAGDAYVKYCENKGAKEAAVQARQVVDDFAKVCDSPFISMVNERCISRFFQAMKAGKYLDGTKLKPLRSGRKLSDRTIANRYLRLKAFLRHAKLDVDKLMPKGDGPKWTKTKPTIYSPDEVAGIRNAADDYMLMVIDLALMLGLRDQEIMYAMYSDVNFHTGEFRVQDKPSLGFVVKDKEERDIPIPAPLLERIAARQAAAPEKKLIVGTKGDDPNTHLLRTLKRLAKRAGLNCGECDGCTGKNQQCSRCNGKDVECPTCTAKSYDRECRQWNLHKFRRTYLTTMLRGGLDLATVQDFAGHSNLASTMRYLSPAGAPEMQSKVNAIWASAAAEPSARKTAG
jgi:integrase